LGAAFVRLGNHRFPGANHDSLGLILPLALKLRLQIGLVLILVLLLVLIRIIPRLRLSTRCNAIDAGATDCGCLAIFARLRIVSVAYVEVGE
jgi:hypothetical protein